MVGRTHNNPLGWMARAFALCGLVTLVGCNETASDFNPNAAPRARAAGVPVALVSLEGAPESVTSRLSVALSQQAARRDILIVGIDGKPRYQIRGYVSLSSGNEAGANIAWTFDLFDASRKRAHRASGSEPVSSSNEAWGVVKDADLDRVAFRALDEVAEFLAASPAPVVAQPLPGPNRVQGASAGRTVGLLAGQ